MYEPEFNPLEYVSKGMRSHLKDYLQKISVYGNATFAAFNAYLSRENSYTFSRYGFMVSLYSLYHRIAHINVALPN